MSKLRHLCKTRKKQKGGAKEFAVTAGVLEEIRIMAGQGMTVEMISDFFRISHQTFYNHAKKHPELIEAAHYGKALAIRKVSGKLMEKIEKGDTNAITFYLKTQAGFSNKAVLEIKPTAPNNIPDNLKSITSDPVEAAKIYQQIMQE